LVAAASTRSRVAGSTCWELFSTRETVAVDTPASNATSFAPERAFCCITSLVKSIA
jgi:hypothetical protein